MAFCRAALEISFVLCVLSLGRFSIALPLEEMEAAYYKPSDEETSLLRQNLLEALGFKQAPDVSKMNISQEEYNRAYSEYLSRVQNDEEEEEIEEMTEDAYLRTEVISPTKSNLSGHRHRHLETIFTYEVRSEILSSRISNIAVNLEFGKVLEPSKHRFRILQVNSDEKKVLFTGISNSSHALNITLGGEIELSETVRLSVTCSHCFVNYLKLVVNYHPVRRVKRSSKKSVLSLPKGTGTTDCPKGKRKSKEKLCCRHPMKVSFRDLPGFDFILAPDDFDAYFCGGNCPARYNPAHNHALLQFMLHTKDRKLAPKPCCAPAKLKHLEILHMDEHDPGKLNVTKWKNVIVTECACS